MRKEMGVLKHPKLKRFGWLLFVLLFIAAGIVIRFFYLTDKSTEKDSPSLETLIAEAKPVEDSDELYLYATSHKEEPEADPEESDQGEIYATSHKGEIEEIPPLTSEAVKLSDIYAEKDSFPVFKSYYPDAEQYSWEIYDMKENRWKEVSANEVTNEYDELHRKVSVFHLTEDHSNDEIMVRCTIDFAGKDSITDIATLHILEKDIVDLSIEDFKTNSGYINAQTIPVSVKYEDGSQDVLTGLSGLYFLEKQESSEYSTVSGNTVETITTVITACDYFYLGAGESNIVMRYQANENDKAVDIPVKLTGEDLTAPVITKLDISDFTISTVDIPVMVNVTILAEDNSTPYPKLLYAFLPEGQEIEDDDWHSAAAFEVDITQNGKWIAYCKDQAGNIASEERNLIVVDNKAPVVSLSLESEEWCQTNKILVSAKDGLSVEYCYSCVETGENSGWIARNEYEVKQNSTWNVKVRDAAGNITEQDIIISNIDCQTPVIRNITEKEFEKGEIIINEKKN